MDTTATHKIKPRRVSFDLSHTPLHWLPQDPEASYMINTIHLLLPAGEFWFCRIYNKALPLVNNEKLRDDVQGFIRQEAMHARSHETALEDYLRVHGVEIDSFLKIANFLFDSLLSDRPLGLPDNFITRRLDPWWLKQRVGLIAAIEHYTCVLGKWIVEAKALDENRADPVMLDLFRWHGAEEVEHRNVAHDLHVEMGGSVRERQIWGVVAGVVIIALFAAGSNHMMKQDPGIKPDSFFRRWWRAGKRGTMPEVQDWLAAAARYFDPDYHPEGEAPLNLALEYFARSPAVQAALAREKAKMAA